MAGSTTKISPPWPHADGLLCIESKPVNIAASKTDHVWDVLTIPFKCELVWAEWVSQAVTITNGVTVDVLDDSGTPQIIIENEAITAITDGAAATTRCTVDDTGPILPDSQLKFRYTSGASDTSVATKFRLWVRPLHV